MPANGDLPSEIHTGIIKGRIADAQTGIAVPWASISVVNSKLGDAADSAGHFEIIDVPIGAYSLKAMHIGYQTQIKADIIIKPGRTCFVEFLIYPAVSEDADVIVSGGYFVQPENQPLSAVSFSTEEIRRATGTGGDVSRILNGLPSLAKVEDEQNDMIVRGGSSVENTCYINGIEIPNLNHFPVQGSSGGLYSMLDIKFISNLKFYTGGFSAAYGDRMSSVMDISLREGNRDEFDGQADVSVGAASVFCEGPLVNRKGSWMLSARRSSIDLAFDMMGENIQVPEFRDIALVADYDINDKHQVNVLGIFAVNFWDTDYDDAVNAYLNWFGQADINRYVGGLSWRALWNGNLVSNFALSYSRDEFDQNWRRMRDHRTFIDRNSAESEIHLRNVNFIKLGSKHKLEFGGDIKEVDSDLDDYYGSFYDQFGHLIEEEQIRTELNAQKYDLFITHTWNLLSRFTVNTGIRYDYFSINNNSHFSPRFSISCALGPQTSLSFATGLYYQSLPMILLSQQENRGDLEDMRAEHYIISFRQLVRDDLLFTLEIYDKEYHNCPMNPYIASMFLMDQAIDEKIFLNNLELVSNGKARSYGMEIMLQKKLSGKFYGLLAGSWFRARYRDLNNIWRDRIYDNRYLSTVEIGFKPDKSWEFNLRWYYAGGRPYTPYVLFVSGRVRTGILDITQINGKRMPDYRSITARIDRHIHFSGSRLTFYINVWNVFNEQKDIYHYWTESWNYEKFVPQWPRVIIFGVEYEF